MVIAGGSLSLWWLGWYPGFLTAESVRMWGDVTSGDFTNFTPATHTIVAWTLSRIWDTPAIVTLLQSLLALLLLALFIRRMRALGVPAFASGIAVVLFGLLPGTATATVTLEVTTAQALVAMWLFVETLDLVRDSPRYLGRWQSVARLGCAAAAVALFDHAGIVIVAIVAVGFAVVLRRQLRLLVRPGLVAAGVFVLFQVPVFELASVDRLVVPVAEVFAPDLASIVKHAPEVFGDEDRLLLEAVADLEVWSGAYRCGEGIALVRDRDFDVTPIRDDPGSYRGLLLRAALQRPLIVIGHRMCASGLLFLPAQPTGERFEAYTYNVPQNEFGLERETKWARAFSVTKAILVRTDRPSSLWLFWRPAIVVWLALLAFAVAMLRRRRQWTLPAIVFAAVLMVTALTIRAPAFGEVFAVYSVALLSLPVWWAALRREPAAGLPAAGNGTESEG